jgi:hypothetical protein
MYVLVLVAAVPVGYADRKAFQKLRQWLCFVTKQRRFYRTRARMHRLLLVSAICNLRVHTWSIKAVKKMFRKRFKVKLFFAFAKDVEDACVTDLLNILKF